MHFIFSSFHKSNDQRDKIHSFLLFFPFEKKTYSHKQMSQALDDIVGTTDHIFVVNVSIHAKEEIFDDLCSFLYDEDNFENTLNIYNIGYLRNPPPENRTVIPAISISVDSESNHVHCSILGYMSNTCGRVKKSEEILNKRNKIKAWCKSNRNKLDNVSIGSIVCLYF